MPSTEKEVASAGVCSELPKWKDRSQGGVEGATPQKSNKIDSCSLYHSYGRACVVSCGLPIQFYSQKRLNQQTVGGRSSWSLLGDDPPASVVISVYKAYEALAEVSGFLDKALLLQWCRRLANNRGNSLICFGFNSFNDTYCAFSNQ